MVIRVEFSENDFEKIMKLINAYEKNKEKNRDAARVRNNSTGSSRRGRKCDEPIKWKIVNSEDVSEPEEEK